MATPTKYPNLTRVQTGLNQNLDSTYGNILKLVPTAHDPALAARFEAGNQKNSSSFLLRRNSDEVIKNCMGPDGKFVYVETSSLKVEDPYFPEKAPRRNGVFGKSAVSYSTDTPATDSPPPTSTPTKGFGPSSSN